MTKDDLIPLQQKVTSLRVEGKYKETIESCYTLLNLGTQLNDCKSILTAYVNLAASFYCIGDIESAFNIISVYEEICESHGDDSDKLNSYNIFFLLYEYNKDIANAKATLEKSIALGKKLKKYNIVSNGYSNYSHICITDEDFAGALRMAEAGLEMAKLHEPNTPILELRVKLNIARAQIGLNNFDTSKLLIDEMINDPILDSFPREKAQCYDLQGHWYSKQNLHGEALESFTAAKNFAEANKDVYLLRSMLEEMCRLCELIGDIDKGFKLQKQYISLLKEINEKELSQTALKLEIKHSVAALQKKADTDQLTGLYNRDYVETASNKWLKIAYEKSENVTCIAIDIDNFKAINDQYGHLFGDEVVKQVSKAFSSILRASDLIGRYGGDEFIIILKDTSIEDGKRKAEQLLETVRALEIYEDDKLVPITISVGVADNLTIPALHFNELFYAADLRLYKAKQGGRNQVCANS